MKALNIATSVLLNFTVGVAVADVEMSSLVQWEETQNGQLASTISVSNDDIVKSINAMEATAAGANEFSSLVQMEESQYATPYSLIGLSNADIIANINKMDATAAGQSQMSGLIQWE